MLPQNLSLAWQSFQKGRLLEAEKLAGPFASHSAGHPQALLLLGVIHSRTGRPESALKFLEAASLLSPGQFEPVNWLSFVSFQKADFPSAEKYARKALTLQPGHSDALNNLGLGLYGQAKYTEAVVAYQHSVKANPRFAPTYKNLGSALLQVGDHAQAEAAFKECVALGGDSEPVRCFLSDIAVHSNDYSLAALHARKAMALNPTSANAHVRLGTALWLVGNPKAAEALQEAVRLDPGKAEAFSNLGAALISLGRMDEAQAALRRSIELQPLQGSAYYHLIVQTSSISSSEAVVEAAQAAYESEELPLSDRSMLCYALAKLKDREGQYGEAMGYYDRARDVDHQIFHGDRTFDAGVFCKYHEQLAQHFGASRLEEMRNDSVSSTQPIFILGMMRSGTTLVDQIVSSHRSVKSAGEVGFLFKGRKLTEDVVFSNSLPDRLPAEASSFTERLVQLAGPSNYITDKMPANYFLAGIIHAAFPKAKIIHVKRNAVDNCLSIWTTANRTPPLYSHHKGDVILAYREYERLMEHWHAVIPGEAMMEVSYEDLIENSEPNIRKLIDFCGLEWDDACLHHEHNPNAISTPSLWQARQPIYRSSMNRWEKYLPFLGEFRELL